MFIERNLVKAIKVLIKGLKALSPTGDLLARIWVAKVFFHSAMLKIASWPATLSLFSSHYPIPLLSPEVAAYMATGAELVLPILLLVGLGGRMMILIFFIYNLIAAIAYDFVWTPTGFAGFDQHLCWGLLLAMLLFHGPGKLSLDYLFLKRYYTADELYEL